MPKPLQFDDAKVKEEDVARRIPNTAEVHNAGLKIAV